MLTHSIIVQYILYLPLANSQDSTTCKNQAAFKDMAQHYHNLVLNPVIIIWYVKLKQLDVVQHTVMKLIIFLGTENTRIP